MPDKKVFFTALSFMIAGVGLAIFLFIIELFLPAFASLALVIYGANKMLDWHTVNYLWRCDKCKTVFKISKSQNLLGINGSMNRKLLYCSHCRKRRWCNAVPKNYNDQTIKF